MTLDTIGNWLQFGPDGTTFASNHGTTQNAVGFTVTTNSGQPFTVVTQPGTFNGQFASADTMWADSTFSPPDWRPVTSPNSITLTFDTPIQGLTTIAVQPNLYTEPPALPYHAIMDVYSASGHLGSSTYNSVSINNPGSGSIIPSFIFDAGSAIVTHVIFSVTGTTQGQPYDQLGIILGPSPNTPPPPTPGAIFTQGQIF